MVFIENLDQSKLKINYRSAKINNKNNRSIGED